MEDAYATAKMKHEQDIQYQRHLAGVEESKKYINQ